MARRHRHNGAHRKMFVTIRIAASSGAGPQAAEAMSSARQCPQYQTAPTYARSRALPFYLGTLQEVARRKSPRPQETLDGAQALYETYKHHLPA